LIETRPALRQGCAALPLNHANDDAPRSRGVVYFVRRDHAHAGHDAMTLETLSGGEAAEVHFAQAAAEGA
jgi:hypothetical protein